MIELSKIYLQIIILACYRLSTVAGDRQLLQFNLDAFKGPDFGFPDIAPQPVALQLADAPAEALTIDGPDVTVAPSVCQILETSGLPQFSLSQSDFDSGTKIISEPGIYTLTSDVVFNPNSAAALGVEPYYASDVQPQQFQTYDPAAFGIGFFAAISIAADNILINLDGYTIEQGKEHALNQRFFNLIELASAPFVKGQGPHFFGTPIITANNVCIKNGVLARSSHNGIHGNRNQNVEIRDLTIKDYEVGAIQLNFARDVLIENIDVPFTRTDVPIQGRFSAARFIRPWINKLVDSGYTGTLNVGGQQLTALDVQTALRNAINDAANQVLQFGIVTGDLKPLFGNPSGLPDGSIIYGIITNFDGVAVDGLPNNVPLINRSQRILIRNFQISRMELDVHEIPALTEFPLDSDRTTRLPATDAVGAALETQDGFTITSNGVYVGNPVANAQLLVAKAQNENFPFNFGDPTRERKQITPKIVEWAESGLPYTDFGITYMCNSDLMFHVTKGAIAFKLDSSNDLKCEECVVFFLRNDGDIGSTVCNDDIAYRDGVGKSSPIATQPGYNGGAARGFSISSSSNVQLLNCEANSVLAKAGDAIGFDVTHGSSQVQIIGSFAGIIQGGYGYFPSDYVDNPTRLPISVALREDNSVSGVASNLK